MGAISDDPIKSHEYYKRLVTPATIRGIEGAPSLSIAVDLICEHGIEQACALLDSMSPLGAAFVLIILRARMSAGDKNAECIVKLAESLGLRATQGLVEARNETYERTGVFLP